MYEFRGVFFGFEGRSTVESDAERLRLLLEAYASCNVLLFSTFRTGTGERLPHLGVSRIRYFDPGFKDPPLVDAAVCFLRGAGACGTLSAYMVGWYRGHGEDASFRLEWEDLGLVPVDGVLRHVSRWHVNLRRENGDIENWSRLRGMKT